MNDKRGKILGTIVFVVLISLLFYLIFFLSGHKGRKEIEMIEVTGNILLEENEYLGFTMLSNISEMEEISLPVIKDRFEKHPYVKSANVEISSNKKTRVLLTEKNIMAVVLIETQPYFLTEDFQILPMLMNTKFVMSRLSVIPGL
jgi:cell division septal protein FtsQ